MRDVGREAAARSGGLLKLASRSVGQAERDCHRLVGQYSLGLPIPKTDLKTGRGFSIPVLRLRDWAQFLIDGNHSHMLVGLRKPDWEREAAILKKFWELFRCQNPDHPVFEQSRLGNLDLGKTFPMVFHGDEGRGRKHTPQLVLNFHSVLGRGVRVKNKKKAGSYIKMSPNFHGHSLTTRFLLAAVPKVLYSWDNDEVWQDLM